MLHIFHSGQERFFDCQNGNAKTVEHHLNKCSFINSFRGSEGSTLTSGCRKEKDSSRQQEDIDRVTTPSETTSTEDDLYMKRKIPERRKMKQICT